MDCNGDQVSLWDPISAVLALPRDWRAQSAIVSPNRRIVATGTDRTWVTIDIQVSRSSVKHPRKGNDHHAGDCPLNEVLAPLLCFGQRLLTQKGAGFTAIDIDTQPEKRAEMIEKAGGRTTVPQIFIKGRHIGGSDDLHALDQRGNSPTCCRAEDGWAGLILMPRPVAMNSLHWGL